MILRAAGRRPSSRRPTASLIRADGAIRIGARAHLPRLWRGAAAGYAEACTNCGFSPAGPQHPQETFEVGGGETIPSPGETSTRKRRGPGIGTLIWLAIIGGSFVAQGLGVFDEPTGPGADQVEGALVLHAAELGATVTADCPDDAEETEIGDGFECVLTNRAGRSRTIEVINREDSYEWQRRDLVALAGRRR